MAPSALRSDQLQTSATPSYEDPTHVQLNPSKAVYRKFKPKPREPSPPIALVQAEWEERLQQMPLPSRKVFDETTHPRTCRVEVANPTLHPTPVPTMIIAELNDMGIRFTSFGFQVLDLAYSRAAPENVLHGPLAISRLARLLYTVLSNLNYDLKVERMNVNSGAFRLFDVLYSNSDLFRNMIESELDHCGRPRVITCDLPSHAMWVWASLMLDNKLVEQKDVKSLPAPDLQEELTNLFRGLKPDPKYYF
ncbi:hypothetical protein TWF506_000391 [Arthrobotrys conoides]|uniref:Uncharacterized protein n=1 Tax=Arthrobotrys conoides TaxID=74498 RepID=A0AAN8NDT6_9PEZI